MTKRDFQKIEYDREQLEKDTMYVSRRQTIEDMVDEVLDEVDLSLSLTKDERFAIRYCLNITLEHHSIGEYYDRKEVNVDGINLKETLLNLLENKVKRFDALQRLSDLDQELGLE